MSVKTRACLASFSPIPRAFCFIAALALTVGCNDGNGPPGEMCSAPVTFQVSAGTVPTIEWTPRCSLHGIRVIDSGDEELMWQVESTEPGSLASGVVYGVAPDNAVSAFPAKLLVGGTAYRLVGARYVGGGFVAAGLTVFTP